METEVTTESTNDQPRLSVVTSRPPSSSPFPSPGSAFLPPPRQEIHEFAPPQSRLSRKKDDNEPSIILTTPTQDQITSSRPAPPSPAVSRRASTALSHRSTSSGKAPSTNKRLSMSRIQPAPPLTDSITSTRRRSIIVKIRDFAFHPSDDRYLGNGPDVPQPNKHRRTNDEDADVDFDFESEERRHSGWGGFVWGGLTKRLSWGFGKSGGKSSDTPSKVDFERNFDATSPVDEKADPVDDDEDEYEDEALDDEDEEEPGELLPGKYRAMFAFDPEGTAEMALVEDQIVHVIGRGGGVGWAVVQREDGSRALVPESYLEFVES